MELNEMEYVNAQPGLPQLEKKNLVWLEAYIFFLFFIKD